MLTRYKSPSCGSAKMMNNTQTVYKTWHFEDKISPHHLASITRPRSNPTGSAIYAKRMCQNTSHWKKYKKLII